MIYIRPSFFDEFKCIANRCTDTCCAGWEVDIDDNTFEFYKTAEGEFFDEIRKNITISADGSRCLKLCENDRCVFLNKDNLCEIIINCGENAVCEICRKHPRFYEWFPGVTEFGLGLCCEEVCRILLCDENPFTLLEVTDGEAITLESKEDTIISDRYIFISGLRESIFHILFKKEEGFYDKIDSIITTIEKYCHEELCLRKNNEILEAYKNTEPIDENWTRYIEDLCNNFDKYSACRKEFNEKMKYDKLYLKILAYIFYRHLTKAAFDFDVASRVCFCLESMRFIELCDLKTYCEKGELSLWDRIENLKRWSKQIEYSEENTDYLVYGELYEEN